MAALISLKVSGLTVVAGTVFIGPIAGLPPCSLERRGRCNRLVAAAAAAAADENRPRCRYSCYGVHACTTAVTDVKRVAATLSDWTAAFLWLVMASARLARDWMLDGRHLQHKFCKLLVGNERQHCCLHAESIA
jgi:hypothetical protein